MLPDLRGKKIWLVLGLILVVFVLFFISLAYKPIFEPTTQSKPQSPTPESRFGYTDTAPETIARGNLTPMRIVRLASIDFVPDNLSLRVDEQAIVRLLLDTSSLRFAQRIDIYIRYDPALVETMAVSPGGIFSENFQTSIQGGIIRFSATTKPRGENGDLLQFMGSGDIATLTIKALKSGTTQIEIAANSQVVDEDKNVLTHPGTLLLTIKP